MEATNIHRYIYLGTVLRYLQDVRVEYPVYVKDITEHINIFLTRLHEFKLPVTERATADLIEFNKDLLSSVSEDDDRILDREERIKLENIMIDLDKVLSYEAEGNIAFIVTDKRNDANKLLFDMSSLMAPSVFNSLSDLAKYDFKEAGRCIAFEVPTAGAFHLLRGTEAVLRDYYCSIYKRNRIKDMMWGPMIKHLQNRKSKPLPPEVLLKNLDNIRVSFRNPTQHPELRYNIEEVQDLLGLCIEVVNRMKH